MPFRIGNNEVNFFAIGANPVRGAAIGSNLIYSLQTTDNPGIITISTVGGGRTRTGALVVTDADGFTSMPTGTVIVRNAADNNDLSTNTLSFSGSGNARNAALPGRRSAQRYRITIDYSDSNGSHQIRVVTTPGSFSTNLLYEVRT